ncbi:bacterial regulatory helix-turn-helix protein, AraC family protein [Asticcacaulis biprosthecium C19]|uniref:Bacterial regulatory helix-turn-helix protein, AraC family protein n=1 Tax=Asticcacaulis biprosthecium C19 TaxID=715226 RepID=F4QR38_9CAUL|nr:transcriptional regulator FtrA [Asticcacaulis biprosthecium]EGF90675.1 bacterial regulatory helix-turn-helix protein, AraC family protein [Asticcacaulis biprosthecium C19]
MPNLPHPNRLVCALAYDGMPLFEFSIAVELFGLDRPEMGPDWYTFQAVQLAEGPCRTTAGLSVTAAAPLSLLEDAGTIIIPGWHPSKPIPQDLIDILHRAYDRGARIVTICSGAFVLAAAGLLKGRRATTHWKYVDYVTQHYPEVELVPDVLYIDEGQILTSAGSAAGIDLCLHLIRRDYGPEAANKVARRLVVPPHRDGGQAQYIERAVPTDYESKRLGPLLDFMRENLNKEHRIPDLARRAGMSERTFLRRFSEATGTTPAKWLLSVRLNEARDHLEASDISIELIAECTGFGTTTNLRHHFREHLNTTPTAYRQTFSRAAQ